MTGRKKHNPSICFGCRLHALMRELYPDGPQNTKQLSEVMVALAGCSADMLQHTNRDGLKLFFTKVMERMVDYEYGETLPMVH